MMLRDLRCFFYLVSVMACSEMMNFYLANHFYLCYMLVFR